MRLLLAEDEEDLSRALTAILKHANYTVDAVYSGKDALDYALLENYDGIILDIMMPEMEGTEVLKRLREKGNMTPVLFLTAKSTTDDKITGLDLGADDYLTKPFDTGELLARVRAMTRRRAEYTPTDLKSGDLVLNRTAYTIASGKQEPVHLSGKEFQMMEMLMEQPGRVISGNLFMEHIWADADADDSVIWVNISNLRKKLIQAGSKTEIKAKRGIGYFIES
ncbi:MAG: response regulator transcription factor [Lachnospiraceae bacterium]|nr:response regulator transcription factor [Lachnospiraceae bacterium]